MHAIEKYIASFCQIKQDKLNELYILFKSLLPKAEPIIKYGIPTFYLNENIVHFAAFKNHIGLYPGPAVIAHFTSELSKYKTTKGAIQFQLTGPLPISLISTMIQWRLNHIKSE